MLKSFAALAEVTATNSLGVSRPVVREALIALEIAGLVEIRTGSGTYIRDRGKLLFPYYTVLMYTERDGLSGRPMKLRTKWWVTNDPSPIGSNGRRAPMRNGSIGARRQSGPSPKRSNGSGGRVVAARWAGEAGEE